MKVVSKSIDMANKAAKWKESASLITLAKSKSCNEDCDYKVLLFSRSSKSSFMPMYSVFPGGACETVDESPLWLKHFQSMGVQEDQLKKLIIERNPNIKPQPGIFQTTNEANLHRDISLRITAIRETFEEVGIMLCRSRDSILKNNNGFGYYREDFDREHWQHLVHNDASQFLKLCQELDVMPDLWGLNEWSVWLSPAFLKKRFETVFYTVALPNIPNIMLEKNEAAEYKWMTPKACLIENLNCNIVLEIPQFFELSRLFNINTLDELNNFAAQRASKGSMLLLPVYYACKDGPINLLPGDSNYPSDPNEVMEFEKIDMTKEEFRHNANKLFRCEFSKLKIPTVYLNFEPIDGHLKPANVNSYAKL